MARVCETSGPAGYELGVEVDMGVLCVHRWSGGLHHVRAGQYVCVELVRARDLESWQGRRQLLEERSSGMEAPAGELLRERLYGAEPGRREDARARMSTEEAPAGTGEDVVEEDLRTLWIDRDDQGQRFKKWKNVCSESCEERQADSPVAGPPSCLTVWKQMQHHGGNAKLWMHPWMKELGVSGKDCLYHEVSTLVEIPYQGGTYDQLNVGAVASLEIVSRRLTAIVEATPKGLDSLNWETARHYTGTSTVFDLAPHELRAYATRAPKDEAEIDSMRTRGRYVARTGEAVAVGGLPCVDDVVAAGAKSAAARPT